MGGCLLESAMLEEILGEGDEDDGVVEGSLGDGDIDAQIGVAGEQYEMYSWKVMSVEETKCHVSRNYIDIPYGCTSNKLILLNSPKVSLDKYGLFLA